MPPPVETPPIGLVHPDAPGGRYFESLEAYLAWYDARAASLPTPREGVQLLGAPTVGLLLYRKHVISHLGYIDELIRGLEAGGLRPLPVFINGVEAHTVVRDAFTSQHKIALGVPTPSALGSAHVDAIVNTIGFPLVGGPAGSLPACLLPAADLTSPPLLLPPSSLALATSYHLLLATGSMAAGRRVDVAAEILHALDVPYLVAAPLLIQDDASWRREGVQGLQQVVLYALPELDGAVDTVVLGGLKGDDIVLDSERVDKLAQRLNGWIRLRAKPPEQRRLALLLYGFPPNVGATGTAALLDVPSTLDALLERLRSEGYDVGGAAGGDARGETLIAALATITAEAATARGAASLPAVLEAATKRTAKTAARVDNSTNGLGGAEIVASAVDGPTLRSWLGSELSQKLEAQWGELRSYRGIASQADGGLVCAGLQLGNIFLGVQPLLGIEGDPIRLMFERDLTPHPQYCAFYEWLWAGASSESEASTEADHRLGVGADAVVHLGMHGTVEWLPGSPLGGTATTWPDKLLGGAPNIYLYAANNPSESILAKRRESAVRASNTLGKLCAKP